MTKKEFQDWYDSLNKGDKLRVMKIICDTEFEVSLDDEDPEIQRTRAEIKNKFYGKEGGEQNRPLAYDPDNVLELQETSLTRVELIHADQLINPKTTFTVEKAAEEEASLREDPDRILAYDTEKNVYILKVPVEELNTIRSSLKSVADFMRGTQFHNTDADILSQRIEAEVKNLQ